jgi:dTDP-4-amino-4,6-dideoxygalactose transaminase
LTLIPYDPSERGNYQYVVMEVDPTVCPLTRDELLRVLHADNVLARRYFFPGCHRMEPYRTLYPEAGANLPNTERLSDRILALPTGTAVGPREIERVAGVIRQAFAEAAEVRRALARG